MAKEKTGGTWQLNYNVKIGRGNADKKFKCNLKRQGDSLHIVAGAGIPEIDEEMLASVEGLVDPIMKDLDGADADEIGNHQKCLRMIAGYCTALADMIGEDKG